MDTQQDKPTLVLGGTGKTGRRVVERLGGTRTAGGMGVRSGEPPFDWDIRHVGTGAGRRQVRVRLSYYPDLALPGAVETIGCVRRAGRRERGPAARATSPAAASPRPSAPSRRCATRGRADDPALDLVHARTSARVLPRRTAARRVALPAGDTPEPFVDADDIADVAVAALTEDGHVASSTS